jgi:hypothetical protein
MIALVRTQGKLRMALLTLFAAAALLLVPDTAQAHDTATVNVAHFAPFGTDVDGTSVTIKVTGEGVDAMLEEVKFGDVVEDVELPAGVELTIQVIPTGATDPAIEAMVTLDAGAAYTVAAIGGANNWDLQLLPLDDETMAPESGALVRIGHLAPFADANTEDSTAVDICTDAGAVILPGVEYPQVTDYLSLDAGVYDLLIALADSNCETVALDLPPVALTDSTVGSVFAIGLLPTDDTFPLNVWTDLPVIAINVYLPFVAAE